MNPEYSPSELEALRLQRDIDQMVRRECKGEHDYENFKPESPRKTKPKKQPRYKHKCKRCGCDFENTGKDDDYCCVCSVRNQRDEWDE